MWMERRVVMIANATPNGWEIIYQRAHGLLAAQIAFHWQAKERPSRWMETLAAIAQHDDGGKPWKGKNHLTDGGAPEDFTLSTAPSLDQPITVSENSQHQSRWVALLTSMHMTFLWSSLRDENGDFQQFIDAQFEQQKRWRKELGLSQDECQRAYALMQLCDRFSLILCHHELPEDQRALEIAKGPDGTRYDVVQRQDGTLNVTPWPFETEGFSVWVEATYVDHYTFESDEVLLDALKQGRTETLTWEFRK
jgi:hypothetical protein